MSCCPMSYWCVDGVPTAGTVDETFPNIVRPPEGAEGPPYPSEEEAMMACPGSPLTLVCGDLEVECPAYIEWNWLINTFGNVYLPYAGGSIGQGSVWGLDGETVTAVVPRVAGTDGGSSATYSRGFYHYGSGYHAAYYLHAVCIPGGVKVWLHYAFRTDGSGSALGVWTPATTPWVTENPPVLTAYGASKFITASGDLISGAELVGPMYLYDIGTATLGSFTPGTLTLTAP